MFAPVRNPGRARWLALAFLLASCGVPAPAAEPGAASPALATAGTIQPSRPASAPTRDDPLRAEPGATPDPSPAAEAPASASRPTPFDPTPLALPETASRLVERLPLDHPWVGRPNPDCVVALDERRKQSSMTLVAVSPDGSVSELITPVLRIIRSTDGPPLLLACEPGNQVRLIASTTWAGMPLSAEIGLGALTPNADGTQLAALTLDRTQEASPTLSIQRIDLASATIAPVLAGYQVPPYGSATIARWVTDTLHLFIDDAKANTTHVRFDIKRGSWEEPQVPRESVQLISPRGHFLLRAPEDAGSALADLRTGAEHAFGEGVVFGGLRFNDAETMVVATARTARSQGTDGLFIVDLTASAAGGAPGTPLPAALPDDWAWSDPGGVETTLDLAWMPDQAHVVASKAMHGRTRTVIFSTDGGLRAEAPPLAADAQRGALVAGTQPGVLQLFADGQRVILRRLSADGTADDAALPAGGEWNRIVYAP